MSHAVLGHLELSVGPGAKGVPIINQRVRVLKSISLSDTVHTDSAVET